MGFVNVGRVHDGPEEYCAAGSMYEGPCAGDSYFFQNMTAGAKARWSTLCRAFWPCVGDLVAYIFVFAYFNFAAIQCVKEVMPKFVRKGGSDLGQACIVPRVQVTRGRAGWTLRCLIAGCFSDAGRFDEGRGVFRRVY